MKHLQITLARIVATALLALSILTVHHESPNIGVLTQEGTTFSSLSRNTFPLGAVEYIHLR